jgi:hypothetical protein
MVRLSRGSISSQGLIAYRDQTGSNGANLSFPDAFGIPVKTWLDDAKTIPNPDAEKNQWIQGVINAAPYIASAFM